MDDKFIELDRLRQFLRASRCAHCGEVLAGRTRVFINPKTMFTYCGEACQIWHEASQKGLVVAK